MAKDETYAGKTQAIRDCLSEQPGATPVQIVEILAGRGIQVSPAHVIVVQAVLRSEQAERVAAAS